MKNKLGRVVNFRVETKKKTSIKVDNDICYKDLKS